MPSLIQRSNSEVCRDSKVFLDVFKVVRQTLDVCVCESACVCVFLFCALQVSHQKSLFQSIEVHPGSSLAQRYANPRGRVSFTDSSSSQILSSLFGRISEKKLELKVFPPPAFSLSSPQERQRVWLDSQADPDLRQRDAGDAVRRRLRQRGLREYEGVTSVVHVLLVAFRDTHRLVSSGTMSAATHTHRHTHSQSDTRRDG